MTPISVVTSRNNAPDAQLILTLLLAAWAWLSPVWEWTLIGLGVLLLPALGYLAPPFAGRPARASTVAATSPSALAPITKLVSVEP